MFAEISAWSGLSMTVDHWGEGHPHLLIAEAEERLVPLLFVHNWMIRILHGIAATCRKPS